MNNNNPVLSGALLAACLALAAPVHAQQQEAQPAEGITDEAAGTAGEQPVAPANVIRQQEENQLRSDNLIGQGVLNRQQEEIAEIDGLLIDKDGKVAGVLLSVGGFLGLGEKQVAVPWDTVQMQTEGGDIVVDLNRQQLEQAPEFVTLDELRAQREAAVPEGEEVQVSGTVKSVDKDQGLVVLTTGIGDMQLRLPPEEIGDVQEGDEINVNVQLTATEREQIEAMDKDMEEPVEEAGPAEAEEKPAR
ncbi:MAG: PRC-barrel domain-containing protein [Pseudomonadota bacterium]|nr:PRC-barrel domain-containing protein [Pseudomonadota bacterium]